MEIVPYLPASPAGGNTSPARVTEVLVSTDGTSNWVNLIKTRDGIYLAPDIRQPINDIEEGLPVKDHTGTAVIPCGVTEVKAIKLVIIQDTPYLTKIGHPFYIKTSQVVDKKKGLFGTKTRTWYEYQRVPNEEAQTIYSEGTSTAEGLLGAGLGAWLIGGAVGAVIGGIFGLGSHSKTITDVEISTYYDILEAYRYCIGIRELGLYNRVYAETGTIVSKAHVFKTPVRSLSLIVGEEIPASWDRGTKWLTYQLSADGIVWYDVVPQNAGETDSTVVTLPELTNSVYVRIILKRPPDTPTDSPVVNYYAVKGI
jgi:hypothetical protein